MVSAIVGLVLGAFYYLAAFAMLARFKVKPNLKFIYASIPVVVFSVVWILSALTYNSWGGIIIAVALLVDVVIVWFVRKRWVG